MTEELKVKQESRKRVISATVQGSQLGNIHPDIVCGVCEFCGHPPYACGKCERALRADDSGKFPTHCPNRKCQVEVEQEWVNPLAFCEHYSAIRNQIVCTQCRKPESVPMRHLKVRGIVKPDGSEELVILCSDINCRIAFDRKYRPRP